jgi:CheY-like chemotaxis protein
MASKNFREAIRVLENDRFHMIVLIISDVHLQNGGSVFDFLKWVKKNPSTRDTPFVLLSTRPSELATYIEDGVKTAARVLGAALYITMEAFDANAFRKHIVSVR